MPIFSFAIFSNNLQQNTNTLKKKHTHMFNVMFNDKGCTRKPHKHFISVVKHAV